ncbi:MAG: DegV family protein [Acidimicrobiales bacterium]
MPGIQVLTDSACDLPDALIDQHGIDVVPLTIRFGDEEFVDRADLTPTQFWAKCASSPAHPETAAPSPGAFQERFLAASDAGREGVICINLSSSLSGTYQSACAAAAAVSDRIPVQVVDSRSITMGQGTLVLAAAKSAESGAALDQIVAAVEELVPRVHVFGALDSLEHIKKGGRIGGAQALVGSLLSIKPIIEIANGSVEAESKQRTRSRSLSYLIEAVRRYPAKHSLAVIHGDAPDIGEFLSMIRESFPDDEVIVSAMGAVIGTHAGPRTMGVSLIE